MAGDGLADSGHPIDRVDAHDPAAYHRIGKRPQQLREFGLAAREGGDITRQRPGCRRGERFRRHLLPGRQHLGSWDPPPRRRYKQLTYRPAQAQRIGQQPGGVLAGRAVDAPLQVTDRRLAHPRRSSIRRSARLITK
jgi:hypothetical protein